MEPGVVDERLAEDDAKVAGVAFAMGPSGPTVVCENLMCQAQAEQIAHASQDATVPESHK